MCVCVCVFNFKKQFNLAVLLSFLTILYLMCNASFSSFNDHVLNTSLIDKKNQINSFKNEEIKTGVQLTTITVQKNLLKQHVTMSKKKLKKQQPSKYSSLSLKKTERITRTPIQNGHSITDADKVGAVVIRGLKDVKEAERQV